MTYRFAVFVEGRSGSQLRTFRVVPQKGQFLSMNDPEGKGSVYEVKEVLITDADGDCDSVGDLFVKYIESETDFITERTRAESTGKRKVSVSVI